MSSKNIKKKINFKYNFSEYWNLLKKYKGLFVWLLIITVITEGLFVVDKFLFKIVIDDGAEFIAGTLNTGVFVHTLIILAIIFIGIVIIRTIGKWFSLHFLFILISKMILNLKQKYFNHISGLSHNFHTTHKTGSLISRMLRGAGAVEGMTDIIILNFLPLISQLIIVGFSLAYFSLIPALVIVIVTIVFIGYSYYIQRIQQSAKLEKNALEDSEKGFVSDIFTNIDSVKYFGKEYLIQNRFTKKAEKTRKASLKNWNYFRWFDAGQILILGIGTIFLIYFPLMEFLAGTMSIGTLVFIFTVYGNVVGPMFGFVWGLRGFYRSMADFQDLFEYGKVKNEIKDKSHAKELEIKSGIIEFNDIDFKYGKRKIFEKFNLKIKENEKVALVGHSGCGKTTLLKLLYRLYDVDGGKILIDGKEIKNFKQESLRSEMSIVPQECILFDDTIFNNIKFANPKSSKEDVLKAIKFAQLDKIIQNFPKKEKTIVGERGVKLSGGEKQRVSIARAILANKKILVLDEATSSLDSETEYEIQQDLHNLLKGRTSIIIAHRLSTIMNADRIIVLKEGKIKQTGKHKDLIEKPGEYKKLWNLQKGGYIK
jgi:ATP-binding cassette, subfamily B, heavy metal transporter